MAVRLTLHPAASILLCAEAAPNIFLRNTFFKAELCVKPPRVLIQTHFLSNDFSASFQLHCISLPWRGLPARTPSQSAVPPVIVSTLGLSRGLIWDWWSPSIWEECPRGDPCSGGQGLGAGRASPYVPHYNNYSNIAEGCCQNSSTAGYPIRAPHNLFQQFIGLSGWDKVPHYFDRPSFPVLMEWLNCTFRPLSLRLGERKSFSSSLSLYSGWNSWVFI